MAKGTKKVKGRTVPAKGYRFAKGGRGRVVKVATKKTARRRPATRRKRVRRR